jgi:hypothetical protein
MSPPPCFDRTPLRLDRLRCIDGSFAFLPHRFLRDGFFAALDHRELLLYLLLLIVADRQGMSFYFDHRLAAILQLTPDDLHAARAGLLRKDLLAYDDLGPRYQVLSLPVRPAALTRSAAPRRTPEHPGQAPTAMRDLIRDFLERMDRQPR